MTNNVKRFWMVMVGALLCLTLATAADLGAIRGAQEPGQEKDKPDQGDKGKKKDEKKKPREIYGTIDLRDGSTIQCQFLTPKEITLQLEDLGMVTVPLAQIRFVESESAQNRVSTFGLDLFVGTITTPEFKVRLLNTKQEVTVKRERIKRMNFPDAPQPMESLFSEAKPLPIPKDKKDKKDKKGKSKPEM